MTVRTFPELLTEAGVLLFGENWKTDMANMLGRDRKTILRWANGDFTPADQAFIAGEIRWRLRQHSDVCMETYAAFARLK